MSEEIKKNIINIIKSCDVVQFCTFGLSKYPETRTIANMINNKNDINDLILHFFTNKNSHKIEQLKKNNNVCLYYFDLKTRHAMTLFGAVEIILNKENKEKFWMDEWIKFGYNGKNDENYCIIKFTARMYKYYIENTKEISGII